MRYLAIILLSIILPGTVSGQAKKPMRYFIPMQVGNYWIYSSDKDTKLDTVKIVGTKAVNENTAYVYSDNSSWMERNDSVFRFQSQRRGIEFPCLEYFPYDGYREYQIIIGGDVMGRRSVEKLKKPYVINGKPYSDCYKFEDGQTDGNETVIISKGVGIIEISGPTRKLQLVDYKTQ